MKVKKTHPTIQELRLDEIRPNPLNPRKRFEGPKFDQFCDNIAKVGVLQPILVRPIGASGIEYEIVFGGRRYAAACKNAEKNGGVKNSVIPAQVKNLSDDDALDLMTVENLQREDLTPLEEAQNFKTYVDRFGEDKIPDLAERVNMDPRYIRRRLALLALPDEVLKAWDAGDIQTGHLQQLLRLEDKKEIAEYLDVIIKYGKSVGELKRDIDRKAPPLKWAKFDLSIPNCPACNRNSDVQKKLFDIDCEAAKCLFPKCFKQQQNNYFQKNWKKTGFYKRYHTTGFRFRDDISYEKRNDFYDTAPEKCHACPDFVTLIDLEGKSQNYQQTCIGKKDCYEAARRLKTKSKPAKSTINNQQSDNQQFDGPRVSWHGTYFREKFFQAELPQRIEQLTAKETLPDVDINVETAEMKADRLVLLNLIDTNKNLHKWFALSHGLASEKKINEDVYFFLMADEIFKALLKIQDPIQIRREIRAAAAQGIVSGQYGESTRRLVAAHIGIDLTKDWSITEEYLQKKTKDEMLKMGEQLGIFADEKAQAYLFETLGKKRGKFTTCKKGELMDVFLKSGVELKGRVPDEILADEYPADRAEDIDGNPVDGYDPDEYDEEADADGSAPPWICPDCKNENPGWSSECECGTIFDSPSPLKGEGRGEGEERREFHGLRRKVDAGEMTVEEARSGYKNVKENTDYEQLRINQGIRS